MSGEQGYGIAVEVDSLSAALEPSRELRLALVVLLARLPASLAGGGTEDALWDVHERLCESEMTSLRAHGVPSHYLIIKPVNLMRQPGPETMEKIAGAIRMLADLGLIVGPGEL